MSIESQIERIATSVNTQTGLIEQIATTLAGKAAPSPVLQEKTVTPTTSQQSVTPDSNYGGLSKVTVNAMPTATQATPGITVSSAGLITASATQTAGYVAAGTKSATKQLTTQAAKTITPSTSTQTAVSSGVYTTGAVTVAAIPSAYVKPTTTKAATTYTPSTSNQTIAAGTYCSGAQTIKGDANLKAENIAEGVSIFGITGTHSGGSGGSGGGTSINTGNVTIKYISNLAALYFTDCIRYVDGEINYHNYYPDCQFGSVEFTISDVVENSFFIISGEAMSSIEVNNEINIEQLSGYNDPIVFFYKTGSATITITADF